MRNSSSLDWLRFMHTPNDYRVSLLQFYKDIQKRRLQSHERKAPKDVSFGAFLRWTTKIRTWTNRTKTCCATITP